MSTEKIEEEVKSEKCKKKFTNWDKRCLEIFSLEWLGFVRIHDLFVGLLCKTHVAFVPNGSRNGSFINLEKQFYE